MGINRILVCFFDIFFLNLSGTDLQIITHKSIKLVVLRIYHSENQLKILIMLSMNVKCLRRDVQEL